MTVSADEAIEQIENAQDHRGLFDLDQVIHLWDVDSDRVKRALIKEASRSNTLVSRVLAELGTLSEGVIVYAVKRFSFDGHDMKSVVEMLLSHESERVRTSVGFLPRQELDPVLFLETLGGMPDNEKFVAAKNYITRERSWKDKYRRENGPNPMNVVLHVILTASTPVPTDVLVKFAKNKRADDMTEALLRGHTSDPEVLEALSKNRNSIRNISFIAQNAVTTEQFDVALSWGNSDVDLAVAKNPACTTETLRSLKNHSYGEVRAAVANHQNTDSDTVDELVDDEADYVVRFAVKNEQGDVEKAFRRCMAEKKTSESGILFHEFTKRDDLEPHHVEGSARCENISGDTTKRLLRNPHITQELALLMYHNHNEVARRELYEVTFRSLLKDAETPDKKYEAFSKAVFSSCKMLSSYALEQPDCPEDLRNIVQVAA